MRLLFFWSLIFNLSLWFWRTARSDSIQSMSSSSCIFNCSGNLIIWMKRICLSLRNWSLFKWTCSCSHDVANVVSLSKVLSCLIKERSKTFCAWCCSIDVWSHQILRKRPVMSDRSLLWFVSFNFSNLNLLIVIISHNVFRV